jgi:hypothetical protein
MGEVATELLLDEINDKAGHRHEAIVLESHSSFDAAASAQSDCSELDNSQASDRHMPYA